MFNDFASTFYCSTAVRTGFHNASVSLSRTIARVTRVRDEVSDVTSVNIMLHQCTGKVVRLNIQFEITCSIIIIECNTTMALVVLMERCNFVSADTETRLYRNDRTFHFIDHLSRGSALYIT